MVSQKVLMRIVRSGSVVVLVSLACVLAAVAQQPASPPPQSALNPTTAPTTTAPAQNSESLPAAPVTLDAVLDRVVQREIGRASCRERVLNLV